jgi:hypothetical protein
MSGTFSLGLETALLNHVFAGTTYPPPGAIYIALYLGAPSSTGGGTEVPGGATAYVRMSASFTAPAGNPPTIYNPAAVQWAAAQANWGTIVAGGLFDAATAGNFLGSAMLVDPTDGVTPQPKVIGIGDVFRIPAGNLIVGFSAPPLARSMTAQGLVAPIGAEALMRPRPNVR